MMNDLISRQAVEDLIMETDPWWCEGTTRAILEGVKRLPPTQQWIPVSERLPEESDWYLTVFREPDGYQLIPRVAEYNPPKHTWEIIDAESFGRHEWAGDYYDNLTCVAWQPLPEPFKEVEESGRWVKMSDAEGVFYACSMCGEWLDRDLVKTAYCPNCGVEMNNWED